MEYFLTRWCLQKGLAFLYCIAFLICINQYRALLGKEGIVPIERWIRKARFWQVPSVFVFYCSDRFLQVLSWVGFFLSLLALGGFFEQYGLFVSMGGWFLLWAIYQSFVNAGDVFYSFGWEILLLEAGFLAIFLGSNDVAPSVILIWLYRFLLFRVMLGAGLIKLRCDSCWKDLTSLLFHYETQPLPGPLSRFFHRLPVFIHKSSVIFNHFIEVIIPFFFFWPGKMAAIAGGLTFFFQFMLVISGNFSWLNHITMVLCFACWNDLVLSWIFPFFRVVKQVNPNIYYDILTALLTLLIAWLSLKPLRNLCSKRQVMNCSFDPLHIVNTYGAFGSVTRVRKEIIIEGTEDLVITENTKWLPYEFKGKPGDITRHPSQVSPYHYKIDWQMWFAAMSNYNLHPWFLPFIQKLLEGNLAVLSLLKTNPFPQKNPQFIRAELYEYHFSSKKEEKEAFWLRKRLGPYMHPICLKKK